MNVAVQSLKVFLCNADKDQNTALELYNHLVKDGVDAWLDQEKLVGGQDRDREIRNAVRDADVVIVCLSSQFDEAGDHLREVKIALDTAEKKPEGEIFIVPVRLEECNIPDDLKQWQWVDLFVEDGYQRLMRALRRRASKVGITLELKSGQVPVMRRKGPFSPIDTVPVSSKDSSLKLSTAVLVALIGLVGTIIAALLSSPLIENWLSPEPTPSVDASKVPDTTYTVFPQETPLPASTPTNIPSTPIVSTSMIGLDGMLLIEIPEGEFKMGSPGHETDERPVHTVFLDDYLIDETEVTNAMYAMCVEDGKCEPPRSNISILQNESNGSFYYGNPDFDNYPVIYVSWDDANTYCSWAGRRLPTEAEWEKAASWNDVQQNKTEYPWGNMINCSFANYWGDGDKLCVGDTTPVGKYPLGASFYGVFDMAGNVSEWVFDRYDPEYYDDPPYSNPSGPASGDNRSIRGGSFLIGKANEIRSSDRDYNAPDFTSQSLGFRCAMDATP